MIFSKKLSQRKKRKNGVFFVKILFLYLFLLFCLVLFPFFLLFPLLEKLNKKGKIFSEINHIFNFLSNFFLSSFVVCSLFRDPLPFVLFFPFSFLFPASLFVSFSFFSLFSLSFWSLPLSFFIRFLSLLSHIFFLTYKQTVQTKHPGYQAIKQFLLF